MKEEKKEPPKTLAQRFEEKLKKSRKKYRRLVQGPPLIEIPAYETQLYVIEQNGF